MGEAHVSLQFACVKECLCTGHKLASAWIRNQSETTAERRKTVFELLTWIASPRCAQACGAAGESFWRSDDRSRQLRTGTGAARIYHSCKVTVSYFIFQLKGFWKKGFGTAWLNIFLTAPVCTVSCSLSFHCLVKVAPHSPWEQLNNSSGWPPTGFPARMSFIFFRYLKVTLTTERYENRAAVPCQSYTLWKAFN